MITNTVIETWEHHAEANSSSVIIPDGCRDLIFWAKPNGETGWRITLLDNTPSIANISKGDQLIGYRLKPGTNISDAELLETVDGLVGDHAGIIDRLNTHTCLDENVADALTCLGTSSSVQQAAIELDMSMRNLQRILQKYTGRTAVAWSSLARARQAARGIVHSDDLSETAYEFGYSDQSHMTREFQRWFNTTPAKLATQTHIQSQLTASAYF